LQNAPQMLLGVGSQMVGVSFVWARCNVPIQINTKSPRVSICKENTGKKILIPEDLIH
jgi:hypothetical protein